MIEAAAQPYLVKGKLEEFFWEWLCQPEAQIIVRQTVKFAKGEGARPEAIAENFPSPHFSAFRGSPSGRPSPPGSPHSRTLHRDGLSISDGSASGPECGVQTSGFSPPSPSSPLQVTSPSGRSQSAAATAAPAPASTPEVNSSAAALKPEPAERPKADWDPAAAGNRPQGTSKVIPRFWWPKKAKPEPSLPPEAKMKIHDAFVKQKISEIRTYQQLEPIVTEVLGLSKYFVVPIFHKVKAFYDIVDDTEKSKTSLLAPSPVPITEQMLIAWCQGKIQLDDPVLSFLWVVKADHNNWIEREDFSIFLEAILLTHPGLDFLRETQEFQDRYSDTVISRIFFVYDRKDIGRIYLSDLRRYKPSVIETWTQLADHDDIKMIRDYFSYEHFYVIYCTFWELDSDHDFLLDKDDLLKYDGHALSRRAIDRIFSEIPTKFTSPVPGKMGYEDFIRFLLCDQDRSTDRSVEYWFHLFDLDGDGCIRDHEMKYFYEEQVQRMECLNYDTISFADIMCQMNDMIYPKLEGQFRLTDFKRRRKFAGTFFSMFSSLNKFLTFEHRDPFLAKQEQLDNPSFSDWDRWCADEYLRLAMEEGEEPEEENTRTNEGFIDEFATRGGRKGNGTAGDISL
mmetsp:Transcript_67836/g.128115  ORF Transcript_67836/g.128115 Transcript_67836/m.128115 type:complete len:622 (-) Transcript_67836:109-1974(-)